MTNVCFVGTARLPSPLDGTTAKKYERLASFGQHTVVAFSTDMRPRRLMGEARFFLMPRAPGAPLRYVEFILLAPWLTLWAIVRRRAEVVVAQSPFEGAAALIAVRAARAMGRRAALVVESHGDFEGSLFLHRRIWLPSMYRWLMARIAPFVVTRADGLRAVSKATAAQLRRHADHVPVAEFPAWTDLDLFTAAGSARPASQQRILFAGTLSELKGVDLLIDVFADLAAEFPEASLRLAGTASETAFLSRLRRRVVEAQIEDRVAFLGQLPQARLADEMAAALVLVLPSRSEGLGRVIVEAMATGTPVVGSRVGGIPELVKEGVNGFTFPAGDRKAFAAAVRALLENPDRAAALGAAGAEHAREVFSPRAYQDAYQRLVEAAADRCGRPR